MGQKVYLAETKNMSAASVDLSEFPNGVYILTINKSKMYKVVKQ